MMRNLVRFFQIFESEPVLALCLLEHQGHHSATHREWNDACLGQQQASDACHHNTSVMGKRLSYQHDMNGHKREGRMPTRS